MDHGLYYDGLYYVGMHGYEIVKFLHSKDDCNGMCILFHVQMEYGLTALFSGL